MIHPRSLAIREPRSRPPVWRCHIHGDLEPGETVCDKCEADR